jgi:hypothetical protein
VNKIFVQSSDILDFTLLGEYFEIIHCYEYTNPYTPFIEFGIDNGDILFLHQASIESVYPYIPKDKDITVYCFEFHEIIYPHVKERFKELYSDTLAKLFFISTDLVIGNDDLGFKYTIPAFRNLFNIHPTHNTERSVKYTLFNQSVNFRRLKVFELLKRSNFVKALDSAISFGMVYMSVQFDEVKGIRDYLAARIDQLKFKVKGVDIDIDYIESFSNDFNLFGFNRDTIKQDIQHGEPIYLQLDSVNKISNDSYISFIIESCDGSFIDTRITEKTLRAIYYKNIFLVLQNDNIHSFLRDIGFKTFEDILGLNNGWDTINENNKIITFTDTITYINELPIEKVNDIYNREDVQQRLEHNYDLLCELFKTHNLTNKIILTNKTK